MKPNQWRYVLAGASGVALAVSDWPIRMTVLHFVAFVPIFVGYLAFDEGEKRDWRTGAIFALTYGGILAVSAATVIPVWVALVCGLILWTLILGYAGRWLRAHWLLGPAVVAASVVLAELFVWHVVPVFGMAQCFARVTSAVPMAVQFAAYIGLGGVVFALIFSQAMLASILVRCGRSDPDRLKKVITLVSLVFALGVVNYVRWQRPLGPVVKVAAYGWSGSHELSLTGICSTARAADAEILVTPELGFSVGRDDPEASLEGLAEDIRHANLQAVLGVARMDRRENQALLIDATQLNFYTKNHLIPFMENSQSGQGRRVGFKWSGVQCGVMICQDDNFSDLSRGYAREHTQLMLVPTLDWNPICGLHYESSVMRAIENGYAICRGASGGISALISPKGEVVACHNHNTQRDATCVSGDLTVGDGEPTLYAQLGDWPIAAVSVGIVVLFLALTGRSDTPQKDSRGRTIQ